MPYVPPAVVLTVSGRLLDVDGAPRADAEVKLDRLRVTGRTDADGRFRIELHEGVLWISRPPEYPTACIRIDVPDREPIVSSPVSLLPGEVDAGELRLTPVAPLTGRCLDPDGHPLAGAAIDIGNIYRADGKPPQPPTSGIGPMHYWLGPDGRGSAVTDATGRFTLPRIPPGRFDLQVSHGDFRDATVFSIVAPAGGCDVGDIRLSTGLTLAGQVLDANGRPAEAVNVHARSEAGWSRSLVAGVVHTGRVNVSVDTDEHGRFSLAGLAPGQFTIRVRPRSETTDTELLGDFAAGTGDLVLRLQTSVPTIAEQIAAQQASEHAPRPKTWKLVGRVLERDGAPLPGAQVSVSGRSAVRTDADGVFVLDRLWPGEHRLYVTASGHVGQRTEEFLVDRDMDGFELRLERPGALRGRVDVEDGVNPSSIFVTLQQIGEPAYTVPRDVQPPLTAAGLPTVSGSGSYGAIELHPSADGRFEWPILTPAGYELTACPVPRERWYEIAGDARSDPAGAVRARTNVLSSEMVEVVLRVPRRAAIGGTVTLEGAPVAGASVVALAGVRPSKTNGPRAVSDEHGVWQLAGLTAGPYTVVALAPGAFVPSEHRIEVAPGQRVGDVPDLDIAFGGQSIEGRVVLDPGGQPASGMLIELLPPLLGWCGVRDPSPMDWRRRLGAGFDEPVVTDAEGRFSIPHVSRGLYEVHASGPGLPCTKTAIVLLPWSPDSPKGLLGFGGGRELHDPGALELHVGPPPLQAILRIRATWSDGVTPFPRAGFDLLHPGGERVMTRGQYPQGDVVEVALDRAGDYQLVLMDGASESHEVMRRPIHVELGQVTDVHLIVPGGE